jgi:hypothetical protein
MRTRLVALALAVILPMPVLAGEVVVNSGETLSEIAERLGISVDRLMAANGISDPNHVEAGQRLRVPGGAASAPARSVGSGAGGSVVVRDGETLSEIAERSGVSMSRLMALNGISDPDHLEVGRTLRLGGSSASSAGAASRPAPAAPTYRKGAREHVVKTGESLSEIADGYGLSMGQLVALNQLSDPDNLQVGQRLRLQGTPPVNTPQARATTRTSTTTVATAAPAPRQAAAAPRPVISTPRPQTASPTPTTARAAATTTAATTAATTTAAASTSAAAGQARPDWRTYGPLQVDWANWLPMGGSLVTPTLNGEGQSLYLAINCTARKLNATSQAGQWKTWDDPQAEFEKQLVSDLCKSRG